MLENRLRLQQLFLKAINLRTTDRNAWIKTYCGGDDELLRDVLSLLEHHGPTADPLEAGLGIPSDLILGQQWDEGQLPRARGYRAIRELGRGSQAAVYEAIQESTTQRVALKVLRQELASSVDEQGLRWEVLILAQLKHPGIISLIDCGETDDGMYFMVTEFVDGVRLDRLSDLGRWRRDSQNDTGLHCAKGWGSGLLQLFVKVCEAVDAVHRAGVVHRDLKPSNILVDGRCEPRVLDFGIAKPGVESWLGGEVNSGDFVGSLPWASPEQAQGKRVDVRSDVYSLGVILYQLLSEGRFPYDVSGDRRLVLEEITCANPTPLVPRDVSRPGAACCGRRVDLSVEAVVMKALAKSPEDRYESAGELGLAIRRCLDRKKRWPHKLSRSTSC